MAINPERSGLEVFVNEIGTITIRQDDDGQAVSADNEPMVVVHPDDVSNLIRALETARRTSRRSAFQEREEVTVPAFAYPRRPTSSA